MNPSNTRCWLTTVLAALGLLTAAGVHAQTDTSLTFTSSITDQFYNVDREVNVTLPEATSGTGTLTYTLTRTDGSSTLPGGLNLIDRTLTGTPTMTAAAVTLTYTVTDSTTSATAALTFTVTVLSGEFITTWRISPGSENDRKITIPIHEDSSYRYTVNWGEGPEDTTIYTSSTIGATHIYPSTTMTTNYKVTITGEFPRIFFKAGENSNKIISIDQWGNNTWDSMEQAFRDCRNLRYTAKDTPDLSQVTNMFEMFIDARIFNGDIGNWDVSNVIHMGNMFLRAHVFNQNIGGWNVSNVIYMDTMFSRAFEFNQDIGDWDVSNVTGISGMFNRAFEFNQDIGDWDVSNVINMSFMFEGMHGSRGVPTRLTMFNQDISRWDVSSIKSGSTTSGMFNMFNHGNLSNENYDLLLDGWSTINIPAGESTLQSGVIFDAGNSQYCNQVARDILTETYQWDISDGGRNLDDVACRRPAVTQIPPQSAEVGTSFSYIIPGKNDLDENPLRYEADEMLDWLNFNSADSEFFGTPGSEDVGETMFIVNAINQLGASTTQTFTITVVNSFPIVTEPIESTVVFVGESFSYPIPLDTFSDDNPPGDTLTYTVNINPNPPDNWLSFDTPTLTLFGTPTSTNDIGVTTITVTATDVDEHSVNTIFTVTVGNRIPAVNEGLASTSVFVRAEFSYEIPENAFSDGDIAFGDILTYTVNINPDPQDNWLNFDTPTLTFSGNPETVTDIGINTITVTATDLNGGSVDSSFTVTVGNRIPMVDEGLASTSVFVGDQFSYKIPENAFSDDDIAFDDALTYTANINPNPPDNWLSFDTPMFTLSGTPTSTDDIGINTITVTATDLNGGSVDSSFTVTVGNRIPAVNEGLRSTIVFVGDQFSYEIPENAFSDDDIAFDDTLTYTANINPQDNWLSFDTPTLTFSGTPTSTNDIGITTITVTATDLNGGSVNSSFTLTVPNKPPIQIEDLSTQVAVFGQRFSYEISGAFSDPDGGTLSYSTDENLGWLNFNIDTFSGIPTSETSTTGINTVSFTVTSLNGSTLDSAFILNIVESNKPPIQSTPLEDITVLFDVLFSYTIPETVFSDPDGGSLSYTTNEHPSADWLNFNTETRTFFGTPDLSNLGDKTSITVTAADNNGGIIKDVFIITVEASTAAFITTWIIPSTGLSITIPTFGIGYNYYVNWGDGDTTGPHDHRNVNAGSHTYADSEGTSRTYTVTLIGDFPRIRFSNSRDRDKIISIDQWGINPWSSMEDAFRRCSNLRYTAIDNPNLSRVTNMSGMFDQATVFNGNIGGWDVSNVTDMRDMFLSASAFNQDISGWDVSNVTDMQIMFSGASAFNKNIGGWKVSNVTNMRSMFSGASAFNQDISGWDVSKVTNMREMFLGTLKFNQKIGRWDVRKVENMQAMFFSATVFDQDIGGWDVSNVNNMSQMFQGALAFDQDIGDWDVSSVTRPGPSMTRMFEGATLSTDNYDALLAGWSTIDDDESRLQSRIMFHAGSSQYCNQAARDILTETYIWDIDDDGPLNDDIACKVPTVSPITDQVVTVDMEFSYTIPEDTFSDPTDGDTLTYTVSAYPPTNWLTIDTAGLAFFGTPSVGDIGVITITVIATDNFGSTVEDIFTITVIAPFITTWQVDAGERITIPTTTGNTYSYHVDWGDDSIDTMTYNADAEHTYTTTGSYTVSITGDFPGIFFNNGGDKDKIISIDQWGINTWRSMDSAFEGCTNLHYNAVDNPHLSNVISMKEMFKGTAEIDGNFGDWNVSNISDMTEMFNGVTLSTANYDDLLLGWSTLDESETSLQSPVVFDAGNSQYCSQSRARLRLTSPPNNWDITDGGQTYNCSPVTIDVPSDSSLIPDDPDITNGSVFRLLFVTREGITDSIFTKHNVLTYNMFVQDSVPDSGPLAAFRDQFYALVSDDSVDARANTFTALNNLNRTDALIYWRDGDKVADNYDDLYDGEWDSVVGRYQNGDAVPLSNSFLILTHSTQFGQRWLGSGRNLGVLNGNRRTALSFGSRVTTNNNYRLYALSPLIRIVNMPPILVNKIPDQITPFINTDSFSYQFSANTFNDPDGEPGSLSYSTDENLDWLTFSSGTRTFFGIPSTVTHIGISTITVTATDLSGDSTNSIFTLTVPNRPPEKTDLIHQVAFSQKMFFYQIPEDAFSDPDGGTLLYSTNETLGWLNFSTGNRTFTGRPSLSDIGITTITVTATDLNNGSVDSSFTLTVFNSPPIQIEDLTTQVAVVGKGFSYIIPKGAFIDPDDGSLSYDYTPDESQQWLNFSTGNRTFSGIPTSETSTTGINTVPFTVTDLNGGSLNSHFILNVVEFNTTPTLNQALENQMTYVNRGLNYPIDEPENAFIDPDGGSLLYSTDENLDWLTFSSESRTFSGTPSTITHIGISTITVTATDLNGGSVNSSFTVTVVNRVPAVNEGLASTIVFVGAEFSYEIPENAFSDGDIAFGDTLTYTANINPQDNWLTFSSETRIFSGTPTSTDDIGISTITVTATDLNGGSVNSSFTLTVFNRPPIQITDPTTQVAVIKQIFSYQIPLGAFIDPDNPDGGSESLSYSTDENPVWLSFSTGTRTFLGIPTSENSTTGINTVPFTVTDLNGGSVNSYFILNVVEFNTTPTLNQPLENQMTHVNLPLNYPIDEPENAFIDPDGGSLLYSTDKNPGWLMFSSKTRTFSGTPTSTDDIGISTITVTATDLNGGSVNSSFTLTVPNRPPIQTANLTTTVAVVGKMFSYRIPLGAFIDPDGGSLSYAYTPDEDQIRLSFSSGTRTFSGTPTSTDPIGISTVPFTVTDPNGGSLNSDFVLRITAENRPPTLNQKLQNQRTYVNQVLNYPIDEPENAFIDPDGGSLLYSAKGNPNWFEFSSESRTFSGTPSTITDIGITTITVIAADLNGGSTSDTFTVAVVNRVPAVNEGLASTSVFVGAEFSYEIPGNAFSDGDIEFGDTLTYTANINSQSTWLSFDTPTLTFSGRPTSTDDIGISTITVTATDLNGGSVNNSFTVTVDNRIPTVNAGFASTSVFVGADFSYKILENAFSDGDITFNDTLTYTANINPQGNWLTFASETRTFTGRPSLSDIGISTITVTATDRNGGSVNSSFTVTVDNRIPTVNAGLASTSVFVGADFSYEIPGNAFRDDDITFNDTLTYTANINPQDNWLTFASETRTFSGTPTSTNDIGVTTITVTATDLNGGSVNSSFTVTVVNRVPTVNEGLASTIVFVGAEFSYEIEDAFIDPDGGSLLYSTDENLDWLMFSSKTRTFFGTPSTVTDIGISTITVTATDLNDGSVNSSFTVTVVNRVPTVTCRSCINKRVCRCRFLL